MGENDNEDWWPSFRVKMPSDEEWRQIDKDRRQAEEERQRNNAAQSSSSASNDGIGWLILLGIGGFILYKIGQFIEAHWVSIVTVLGICVVCAIVCIIIGVTSKKPGLKTLFTILTSVGLIVAVLYFGPDKIKEIFNKDIFNKRPQITILQKESATEYAVVISDALNIRAGPSVDNEIVGRLTKDDRIEIIDNSGQWWKIKSGTIEGYADSGYLTNIK